MSIEEKQFRRVVGNALIEFTKDFDLAYSILPERKDRTKSPELDNALRTTIRS